MCRVNQESTTRVDDVADFGLSSQQPKGILPTSLNPMSVVIAISCQIRDQQLKNSLAVCKKNTHMLNFSEIAEMLRVRVDLLCKIYQ